ncbi:SH3 domain-containing protein [Embleya sp. NPDC008237]|uniref:SH3 domain-containing protein n=1 Tax=Embleya sp. NPDC008237 TaxID=3363978 RepID=UPI0036F17AB2
MTLRRRLGMATASALLLTGGAVVVAPGASAASHPSCDQDFRDHVAEISGSNVRLRSKPSTNSTVLRLLQKGADVTVYCQKDAGEANWWYYVKHNASGVKGWVWWAYV